jgi:hypothetical protein
VSSDLAVRCPWGHFNNVVRSHCVDHVGAGWDRPAWAGAVATRNGPKQERQRRWAPEEPSSFSSRARSWGRGIRPGPSIPCAEFGTAGTAQRHAVRTEKMITPGLRAKPAALFAHLLLAPWRGARDRFRVGRICVHRLASAWVWLWRRAGGGACCWTARRSLCWVTVSGAICGGLFPRLVRPQRRSGMFMGPKTVQQGPGPVLRIHRFTKPSEWSFHGLCCGFEFPVHGGKPWKDSTGRAGARRFGPGLERE